MSKPFTRRQAIQTLAGLGAAAVATACGAPAATQPTAAPAAPTVAPAAPAQAPVTLRWNVSDATAVPIMLEMGNKAAATLAAQFPNLKIVPEPPPEDAAQILTQMIAGNAPDVIGQCCDRLPFWAARGQLVSLDDYVQRDLSAEQIKDYPEAHWNSFANDRVGRFAMPMYMGTIVLWYDKTAFDQAGLAYPDETWSWEIDGSGKYDEAMTKLADAPNKVWGAALARGIDRLQNKLVANGANWVDPSDDMKAAFDQPAALDVFQREFDRYWTDQIVIPDAAREGQGWYALMEAGRIRMFENGDWALVPMLETVKSKQWDVAPLPQGPVTRNTLATTDGWVIWKGSQNPDSAWELMKYLQTDEWNQMLMTQGLIRPSRISLFDKWVEAVKAGKPELAEKNLQAFGDAVSYATPLQLFRANQEATEIINEAADRTLKTGEGTDVRAIWSEAATKVNEAQAKAAAG